MDTSQRTSLEYSGQSTPLEKQEPLKNITSAPEVPVTAAHEDEAGQPHKDTGEYPSFKKTLLIMLSLYLAVFLLALVIKSQPRFIHIAVSSLSYRIA